MKQPIVVRVLLEAPFEKSLSGKAFNEVRTHGPFLHFMPTDPLDLMMNFVLTGRLQRQQAQDKPGGYPCFTLPLDDGCHLNYLDIDKKGRVYLTEAGHCAQIPRFLLERIDMRSLAFTLEKLRDIVKEHQRKQVHVVLTDQTIFSSIGRAYVQPVR